MIALPEFQTLKCTSTFYVPFYIILTLAMTISPCVYWPCAISMIMLNEVEFKFQKMLTAKIYKVNSIKSLMQRLFTYVSKAEL